MTLRIDRRFRGPSRSGNGGVSAGLVAAAGTFEGPVEVTLRAPPPLDRDLTVAEAEGVVTVLDGETIIAIARARDLVDDVPPSVPFEVAAQAMAHYRNRKDHPLPECFVCGTAREPDDALLVHPGPVKGRDVVASTWTPTGSVDDGTGRVASHVVWGALDCPSFMGLLLDTPFAVLGRLTASIRETPRVGEPCVVIGWERGPAEGRKRFGGAAIFGEDGRRLAWSHAVWIVVDPSQFVVDDEDSASGANRNR
ncbi:MAG: hypothetical protein AAGA48_10200 [Myxococcota bacterium]